MSCCDAVRAIASQPTEVGIANTSKESIRDMADIKFTDAEKALIVAKVQCYFEKEMDQEIGQFDAEFLLDFFSEQVGAFFYNRGLYDAQTILTSKLDDVADSILELERETQLQR